MDNATRFFVQKHFAKYNSINFEILYKYLTLFEVNMIKKTGSPVFGCIPICFSNVTKKYNLDYFSRDEIDEMDYLINNFKEIEKIKNIDEFDDEQAEDHFKILCVLNSL